MRELLINIINDITPGLIKWKEIIAYSKLIITKNLCGVYNIVPGNYNEHDIKKKRVESSQTVIGTKDILYWGC